MLEKFRLNGMTALVTGAGGQLGTEFCASLAQCGASVIASDLNEKCPSHLQCGVKGGCEYLAMDVADPESVTHAFGVINSSGRKLDILVNNAGIAVFEPFEERSFAEFMRVHSVNVGGVFLCAQKALPCMKKAGGGSIINIGSIYGIVSGDPRLYTDCKRNTSDAYASAKAGVIQLTRYLAVYLAKYNIRVNCISPGGVANAQGNEFIKSYSGRTPLGRMAEAGDLAGALIFLASQASSYVTGHNLVVDGGWTIW